MFVNAQNVGISDAVISPDASSMLEIRSTTKGLLIPRLALVQTTSAAPVTSPATSLLVYNTATVNDVTPGFYYWSGSQWMRMATGAIPASGWLLTGNTNTNPASNFIGTTDAQAFVVRTNNIERLRVLSGGNVGIGTSSPTTGRLVVSYSNTDIYGIHATTPGHAIYGDGSGGGGRGIMGRGGEYGVYGWHLINDSRLGYIGSTNYGVYGQFDTQSYGILGTSYEGIIGYSNKIDGYGIKAEGGSNAVGGIWAQGASGKLSGYFGGMARFYTEYAGQFSIQSTRNTLASNDDPSSVIEVIRKTTAASMGANMGAGILFSLEYGAAATKEYMGAMYALYNGANDRGRLVFSTRSGGTNPAERMTILHNGNVGIGVADPWTKLNVKNGRLAIEYDAGFDHAGALWYHKNPWVYLWRKETTLAAGQGGNIIFAASQNTAGTPADICMIQGARENATNNNTASYMTFYTRPASGDWFERQRITSQGYFQFRPDNATGREIHFNELGIGGSGTEPTIVPSSHLYGFVGTDTRAWFRMYSNQFNAVSTKDVKTNIQPLDNTVKSEYYNIVKTLNVCSYNYLKHDTDSLGNIISTEELPTTFGLIAEESPSIITDDTGKAISLYEYISLLTVALQETQRRIEELEKLLEENGIVRE